MKPKNLKAVFNWENRRVLIEDRVWYFPDYHEDQDFIFPGWNDKMLFGNNNPVKVEYCSGNGAWIIDKAKKDPKSNWVAVEKQFKRVRKIWSKAKNEGIENLVIVCGEGCRWTKEYIPDMSVDAVFVNFPDPWPKERHAKHRIIKPDFSHEVLRILKKSGTITLVTDDKDYSNIMIDVFLKTEGLGSIYPAPYYSTTLQEYGDSYFNSLWRRLGRSIHYHQFEKK